MPNAPNDTAMTPPLQQAYGVEMVRVRNICDVAVAMYLHACKQLGSYWFLHSTCFVLSTDFTSLCW